MAEFREDWLPGNKGLIALAILLLLTTSASIIAVWKWQHDRNRPRPPETASKLPTNVAPAESGLARAANLPPDPDVTPKLVQIGGFRYASLAEAERKCGLALANARKIQAKGASLEIPLYALADALHRQNKFAAAEPLFREMLQSRQARLKPQEDGIPGAAVSFGRMLTDWARAERSTNVSAALEHAREGEKLLRDALAMRLENKNLQAWTIAHTQSRLGDALVVLAFTDPALTSGTRESMVTNAEALLQQGYAGMEQDNRPEPRHKRDTIERLVRLYEAWEKPEKLAEWKQKLAVFDKGAGAGVKSE
jgi:hypothetical protein